MFLDFQSMKIMKEDADQDSASDLSDSERVPIAPSPLAPPELHLRAEEIDPLCLDPPLGQGQLGPEYQYPDFLPPLFSSRILQDAAALPSTESRAGAAPRPGGALGRFVDRLVQLQWLQEQTVQWERARAARGRAGLGPGTPGALKSPGRSKLLAAALARPPQQGPSRPVPARKKGLARAERPGPSPGALAPCPRAADVARGRRAPAPKPPIDVAAEETRKPSKAARLQRWDPPGRGLNGLESNGNLRAPRPHTGTLDPAHPQTPSLKKKGSLGHGGHTPLSSEKKLRTNGGKPAALVTSRFK